MKISIYELLGLVKDGKAPKKIKYVDKIFTFDEKRYCSYDKTKVWLDLEGLLSTYISEDTLNDTVEILEEQKKIPEKLNIELNSDDENKVNYYRATNLECDLAFKINSIIDYLESKGE